MAASRSRYWLWWGDDAHRKNVSYCVLVVNWHYSWYYFHRALSSLAFHLNFPPRIPKPIWTIRYDRSCSSARLSAGMYVYMCSKIMRAQHTTAGRPTTSEKMRTRWPSPQMKMKICYLCLPPHRRRLFFRSKLYACCLIDHRTMSKESVRENWMKIVNQLNFGSEYVVWVYV